MSNSSNERKKLSKRTGSRSKIPFKGKPKIVVLNWMDILNPQAGGQEKYVFEMSRRLAEDGFKVIWIASRGENLAARDEYSNIEVIRIGNIFTYFVMYFYHYFRVKRNAVFFLSMNSIPFVLPLSRSKRIVMIHHRIDLNVMVEKVGILGYISYFLQEFINPILYKKDHIITNSQSSKEDFVKLGYLDINLIKLGVRIPEYDEKTKKKIIVSPGPIKPWKHHDMVMNAFSRLDDDWELVMFGSIESEDYKQKLSSIAAELGISKRVKLLGRISDEEVGYLFKESMLCVLGTEKEGWGLVAMEAQSYGCPVVAFDVPGIRESVLNKTTGLLVDFGDIEAMANAIKSIVYDEIIFDEMSLSARIRARDYSWDECYKEFLIELSKIIGTNRVGEK